MGLSWKNHGLRGGPEARSVIEPNTLTMKASHELWDGDERAHVLSPGLRAMTH